MFSVFQQLKPSQALPVADECPTSSMVRSLTVAKLTPLVEFGSLERCPLVECVQQQCAKDACQCRTLARRSRLAAQALTHLFLLIPPMTPPFTPPINLFEVKRAHASFEAAVWPLSTAFSHFHCTIRLTTQHAMSTAGFRRS